MRMPTEELGGEVEIGRTSGIYKALLGCQNRFSRHDHHRKQHGYQKGLYCRTTAVTIQLLACVLPLLHKFLWVGFTAGRSHGTAQLCNIYWQ